MLNVQTENRLVWIDWARVIACFLVMVVHSTEPFYLGGNGTNILSKSDVLWVAFFEGVSRPCVPLFVLISCYLLLPVKYSTSVFLRHRLRRIIVPFLIWTLMYAFFVGEPIINLKSLLLNFNYAAGHLWFVYMIIGLYMLMPIISPWIERASKTELFCYFLICMVASILPYIRDMASDCIALLYGPTGIPSRCLYPLFGEASWNAYGTFYYFCGFIGYLIFAAYIKKYSTHFSSNHALCFSVPCIIIGFLLSTFGFVTRAGTIAKGVYPLNAGLEEAVCLETTLCNDTLGVFLITIGVFILLMHINSNGFFYKKIIKPISDASYGMYLMHMFVLSALSAWVRDFLCVGENGKLGILTTPIQILFTAIFSFIIVAVLSVIIKKIPYVGKYLIG